MLLGFSQFYTNINCHSNLKQPLMSIIWNRFVNGSECNECDVAQCHATDMDKFCESKT